jgi:pimeloyl-ACP methyl ester carboxylesterase
VTPCHPTPRSSCVPRLVFAASLVASLLATRTELVAAQNTPVLFQHGINSDANTWQPLSDGLASVFELSPVRITTGSRRDFVEQGQVLLNSTTDLPGNAIGVGHSNGGILLRGANSSGRNLRGIVTVGTLHSGAGIARSLADGTFGEWGRYFFSVTAAPVIVYQQYYDNSTAWQSGYVAANFWNQFGVYFGAFGDLYGLAFRPLLEEMTPGSIYINALNSGANLARESSALPSRIGIVSSLSTENGVIFRSLWDQGTTGSLIQSRDYATAAFMSAYFYYTFYDNYDDPYYYAKTQNASLWYDAAFAVSHMDIHWCYNIGAYAGIFPLYVVCVPSDAIVPAGSQIYPGSTRQFEITDVSHNEETTSSRTNQTLTQIFDGGALAIPRRAAPPPTTLAVSISGPSRVYYGDWAGWQAIPSGGVPPYRYMWEGMVSGDESSAGTSVYSEGCVSVGVWDSVGAFERAGMCVTVDYSP